MRLAVLASASLVLFAVAVLALAVLARPDAGAGSPIAPAVERIHTPALAAEGARIDDFEVRAVSQEVWHAAMVERRTRADFLLAPGGAHPGSRFHLAADLVRPDEAEPSDVAGIVARLAGGRGRDVSGFAGLAFWMRATPGLYIVQLGAARVRDHDHFNAYVEVRTEGWQEIRLPYASFRQEGYGESVAWTGRDVVHLALFSVNPGSASLALDDVQFVE